MVAASGKRGVSRNKLEGLNLDLGGGYIDVYKRKRRALIRLEFFCMPAVKWRAGLSAPWMPSSSPAPDVIPFITTLLSQFSSQPALSPPGLPPGCRPTMPVQRQPLSLAALSAHCSERARLNTSSLAHRPARPAPPQTSFPRCPFTCAPALRLVTLHPWAAVTARALGDDAQGQSPAVLTTEARPGKLNPRASGF